METEFKRIKRSRYPMNLQLFAEGDADPDPNPTSDPTPDKTFTQADLDRIVADRLARDRKGREDYDDIKTKLTTLEQADAARDAALNTANQRLIAAEFRSLARDANIPTDRMAAALKLADLTGVTLDGEGNAIGVKEAVEALIVANAYLVEKTQPKPIGGASGAKTDPPDKTKEHLLREAADKARKTGRIEDRMAYAALKEELQK
ncbi:MULTISPECIES: phage scaffolding protein [Paenibacillus]|uniref:phage scaffolding protein n=1 Tax=Paenibacillus TaxID=44249 RepID=UPI00096F7FED|nr:hypothetical protein [Paenibacillus odorifer]OME21581.1 hypothetical protein BSK57_19745 [Paenibacillus odorifer]